MGKHRRGFFKGKYNSYLITAYTSYRKSTEIVNDKDIAKELGISVSTLSKFKKGKYKKPTKKLLEVRQKISSRITYAGRLNQKGKILYKAVKRIKELENQKIKKGRKKVKRGIKELTAKQMKNIKLKVIELELEAKELYEAFYLGEED